MTSGACFDEGKSLCRCSVAGSLYTLCRQVCRTWDLSRGLSPGRRLLQENKSVGLGCETGPRDSQQGHTRDWPKGLPAGAYQHS